MGLNSGHVRQLTSELRALERGKNVVGMIAPSFLIGYSSNLQVMGTGIKSRTCLISDHIGQFDSELHALERRKFFP